MMSDWSYVIVLVVIIGAAFYVMRRFTHAPSSGKQAMEQLEEKLERILEHPNLPFPVKIAGNVDRIEFRSKKGEKGKIRIIDYKTGKVEKPNVTLKQWNGLTEDLKRVFLEKQKCDNQFKQK